MEFHEESIKVITEAEKKRNWSETGGLAGQIQDFQWGGGGAPQALKARVLLEGYGGMLPQEFLKI